MITQDITTLRNMVLASPTLAIATDLKNKILGLLDSGKITEDDEAMLQNIFLKESEQMQVIEDKYQNAKCENLKNYTEKAKPLIAEAKKEMHEVKMQISKNEDAEVAEDILNNM